MLISKWGAAGGQDFTEFTVQGSHQMPWSHAYSRAGHPWTCSSTFTKSSSIRWQEMDWLLGRWLLRPLTAESQISALPSTWQVIPLLIKPTSKMKPYNSWNFQDKQIKKRKRKEYKTILVSLLSALRNHSASPGWISYREAYSLTIYQVQN